MRIDRKPQNNPPKERANRFVHEDIIEKDLDFGDVIEEEFDKENYDYQGERENDTIQPELVEVSIQELTGFAIREVYLSQSVE